MFHYLSSSSVTTSFIGSFAFGYKSNFFQLKIIRSPSCLWPGLELCCNLVEIHMDSWQWEVDEA